MSQLIFMRHGQASFGKGNYDILSELGKKQSIIAAQHLLKTKAVFDSAYSGTLTRQIDTAKLVLEHIRASSNNLSYSQYAGLNEYQFRGIIEHYFPILIANNTFLKDNEDLIFQDPRTFQLIFDQAIAEWLNAEKVPDGIESWSEFKYRVTAAVEQIISENAKDARILLFSSGGVISTILYLATGMSPYKAFRTGWGLVNASFTTFSFTKSGFTLQSFNTYSHLESYLDDKLITYR